MAYRTLGIGELQQHGLATHTTILSALAAAKDAKAGAPPASFLDAMKEPKTFAVALANGSIPFGVADWLTDKVIETEKALHIIRKAIDDHDALPASQRDYGQRDAWFKKYNDAYRVQNTMKFWCMLLPVLRQRLVGRVKPPSYSALRASKSDGIIPNAADVATFVLDEADALIKDLKAQGAMLDGLVDHKSRYNTTVRDVTGRNALGIAPAAVLPAAGVAVVALVTVYLSWSEIALTLRSTATDFVAGRIALSDPQAALAYKRAQNEVEKEQAQGGFGGTLRKVIPWLVGGAAVVVAGYVAVEVMNAKKLVPVRGLGCGPGGCTCGCSNGKKGLMGLGGCMCGGSRPSRKRHK